MILFLSNAKEMLSRIYSPEQIQECMTADWNEVCAYPEKYTDVEYIFSTWGMPALSEEEIRSTFPKLKAVFYAAGSVQYFVRPFLQCGVRVFSAWGSNAVPVAEYTVSQILLANKGYFQLPDRYRTSGGKKAQEYAETFPGNYHTLVGILGAGQVGRHVISLLKPFEIQILVFDPFLSEDDAHALGVQKASLEQIFSECQTISNHLANNVHTQGLLTYSLFSRMKDNATFINTGRGMQVVEEDLIRALKEKPDRTALLDVTIHEQMEPGTPLLSCPNILITPHRAGSAGREVRRMGEEMFQTYSRYLKKEPLHNEITLSMLDKLA